MNSALLTSTTPEWETPPETFNALEAEFGPFTLDPCCTPLNAKANWFFTEAINGLSQPWSGRVFMNPPYGRAIGEWIKKAYDESPNCEIVVCLVPSRTDTSWWHDYCMKGEIRFIRGRLKFSGHKHNAPFPSAVVIFR